MLNAEQLAALLVISRASAYQLMNRTDFPRLYIGKRKLAPKDKVLAWIDQQTMTRPHKQNSTFSELLADFRSRGFVSRSSGNLAESTPFFP
ncbi:AlpA family phage regulatory protein [Intestinibacillus sp. NTUH-41-i26]|uniref:helix-turn-helix transcriptional regulator n=1 Tax=Butyricicoccaceae TaxID=3085642 RepID=UPI001FA90CFA|nr:MULTISPECIES: AlpA family phage regulatory protein [Butyricicoccaceae]WOC76577.1 AlpA family phage regulatory protein [Intestinibacillus sp. NTUH-41-i26]